MNNVFCGISCPFCGSDIQFNVMKKGATLCFGGVVVQEKYKVICDDAEKVAKTIDFVCKKCGSKSTVDVSLVEDGVKGFGVSSKRMIRSECGSLTIRHLGTGNPGIVNFSMLYPVPPQVDNQGNIPLPSGGTIQVFQACVGDIYIYRHIDPPIQVINESQTGFFRVAKKLNSDPGFTEWANIWGKAICAQHPHLQNSQTYSISHPGDRIHLTYNVFSKYLVDKGKITAQQMVEMPLDEQYGILNETLADERNIQGEKE